jgi:alpha-mannosidase
VSEDGYGAALLNDGRYGYGIHDAEVSLSLLKSGIDPESAGGPGCGTT